MELTHRTVGRQGVQNIGAAPDVTFNYVLCRVTALQHFVSEYFQVN